MFNIIPISLEQGLAYALAALGIAFAFRILSFPDLTVDGSFPLGGAVAARLILEGADPMVATSAAIVAGFIAGCCTGFFATKLKINSLLSGILICSWSLCARSFTRPVAGQVLRRVCIFACC